MCGCCDGGALNWPSLPQLWFCFPFFCFLKKYAFQRVCWKLNYMHSRSSFLFLWFIHSAYFSDHLLSNYHPPGILLLFSCPVVSDTSWPHGPHHLPRVCPSSCLLHMVMPSSHLTLCCPLLLLHSVFPSIRVFSNESAVCIRWPNYWSSASASVLPMSIKGWLPLRSTGLNTLLSEGLSRVLSSTTVRKHQFFRALLSLWYSSDDHTWPLERP